MIEAFLENGIASLATFFLVIAYIPQVVRTFKMKEKGVEGISLQFWVLINVALTLLLINAIVVFVKYGTYGYMITETFNEGLAFVMLVMVLKYRKKSRKGNE
jgi:uncharacterized protein with PQ loop repeat